jgi:hypothetical protein
MDRVTYNAVERVVGKILARWEIDATMPDGDGMLDVINTYAYVYPLMGSGRHSGQIERERAFVRYERDEFGGSIAGLIKDGKTKAALMAIETISNVR